MSGPDEDVVYGLLTLAGMELALPLSALREVVPCPADLAGLPVSASGLLGAMDLRGLVLPVVDLRSELGATDTRRPDQVVVVVAQAGQVLGLLVDAVRGITRVPATALQAMTASGERLLFSHTFLHPTSHVAISVLDAAAVLTRPGTPTVADRDSSSPSGLVATDSAQVHLGAGGRRLTVFRCGPHALALDVAYVHTTVPGSASRPSVLNGALCRGVTDVLDREVPVADPLRTLGLGSLPVDDDGAGLVLDFGHGYVVLALSALLDLVQVNAEDVLPVPAFAIPRPELIAGMVELESIGRCLVLDGAALLAERDLSALASVNTSLDTGPADTIEATEGARPAYLTYRAGVVVATPLDQIAEILPFPTSWTSTEVGGAVLGVVVHRRAVLPVLCLATLLRRERGPVTESACVLLVEIDGEHVALAVDGLSAIDRLAWTDAAPEPDFDAGDPLGSARLVQVGEETRLLPDVDLRAVVRAARHTGAVLHPVTGRLDDLRELTG